MRLRKNLNKYFPSDYLACKLFGLASFAVVTVAIIMPKSLAFNGPVICLFNRIINYPCPGCGLTRSVYSFFHGNFNDAYTFHHIGPIISILFIVWSFDIYLNNNSFWNKFLRSSQTIVVILLIGVWIYDLALFTIK